MSQQSNTEKRAVRSTDRSTEPSANQSTDPIRGKSHYVRDFHGEKIWAGWCEDCASHHESAADECPYATPLYGDDGYGEDRALGQSDADGRL